MQETLSARIAQEREEALASLRHYLEQAERVAGAEGFAFMLSDIRELRAQAERHEAENDLVIHRAELDGLRREVVAYTLKSGRGRVIRRRIAQLDRWIAAAERKLA